MSAARALQLFGALSAAAAVSGARAAAGTPRSLDGCVRAGTQTRIVRVAAGHGDVIETAVLGRGAAAVVLANESDLDLCAWLPAARDLARDGYRVLLFDYGSGQPWTEVSAAAKAAAHLGAKRVYLLGASEGAKAAIISAARHTATAGIVSLSAERYISGNLDVRPWAARVRQPILFVTARSDPYSQIDTPVLYRACNSPEKQLLRVPGDAHGIALLAGPTGPLVRARVLAFLRGRR